MTDSSPAQARLLPLVSEIVAAYVAHRWQQPEPEGPTNSSVHGTKPSLPPHSWFQG